MERVSHMKRILIVGGGTAGWIAALYLNRIVRRIGCEVVLVESAEIGTIGVGEATIPTLVHLVRILGLNEQELMRRCSATYKLGIHFEGWMGDGQDYWHPFGGSGMAGGIDLYHFWLKRKKDRDDCGHYSDYAVQTSLAERLCGPTEDVLRNGGYAYHLDANAFAQYLKELSIAEGVRHLFGTVGEVTLSETGDLKAIDIGGDRRIEADLFIDATGFSGLLIEKVLGDPWIDWSNHLLCDRAVAMPLPPDEAKVPYTRSIASPAGWIWRIPLNSRTGTGYVYSSAHIQDDAAAEHLISVSDLSKRRAADPRFIKMRIGRRTEFWKRNCVSIGLASGFLEPLESTGIHIIQKAVLLLADHLPKSRIDPPLRASFNEAMGRLYREIRDFIILHYVVSKRDEPFWRDARSVPLPEPLAAFLSLYDVCGLMNTKSLDLFPEASYHYILAGSGRFPERPIAPADVINIAAVGEALAQRRAQVSQGASGARKHDSMMTQVHGQFI
ncbi:tryptophan halogenase family protein [Methyloferula stellata]|uniref:tryptophan halogenase family protein n=1 Tax=Methyloferula stellata TaxID=876270 RepID=UPI00037E8D89|nr:tryptophan halogenase family protein [Methyloferula stellata]